jgi:hypothetical protein
MTAPEEAPRGVLETEARALADSHGLSDDPPRVIAAFSRLRSVPDWLVRARSALDDSEGAVAKAAEWLLERVRLDYELRSRSTQVPFRERTAGPRFQIALEHQRSAFVFELHKEVDFPRRAVGRVRAVAGVVRVKSRTPVAGDARVVA